MLPWDGTAFGTLQTRGPWVCSSYYKRINLTPPILMKDGSIRETWQPLIQIVM